MGPEKRFKEHFTHCKLVDTGFLSSRFRKNLSDAKSQNIDYELHFVIHCY